VPERQRIEQAAAAAETPVDFLQRDDVRAEFTDHPDNPVWPGHAIGAAAFVDVIGCNFH
jgi:hypothetical protein